MNKYYVFWVKEEFAYHYFYKNDILYRFLNAYQENKDRSDLIIQYHYITNKFPINMLISHLHNSPHYSIQSNRNQKEIEIFNHQYYLSLHIHEKELIFYCDSLLDAEELLFPTLRTFQPLLFVMSDMNDGEYGWISPVTKNMKYNSGQILYSYH